MAAYASAPLAQWVINSDDSEGSLFRSDDEHASRILASDLFHANLELWQNDLLSHMLAEFESSKGVLEARMEQQKVVSKETRSLFERVGSDASGAMGSGLELEPTKGDGADSPEQALLAAYLGVSTRGDWETPLKVLPPLLNAFQTSPQLSALVRQLLGAALMRADRLDEARVTLETLTQDSELDEALAPSTRILSRLMLGDVFFFLFRYRSSHSNYASAQELVDVRAGAKAFDDSRQRSGAALGPNLRLRLLWSAYRSGLYAESLEALKLVCRKDLMHWQTREPAFLAEMMRVGGAVFYENPDERIFSELLRDPFMRTCMSGVSWAMFDKLFRVGRFSEVVETYRRHEDELLSLRSLPLLSEMAAQAAERDRPGLSVAIWTSIVENAAERLRRGGPWETQHSASHVVEGSRTQLAGQRKDELRLQEARKNFVLTSVRRAADDRYESALQSGNKSDLLVAAHLLAVVLADVHESEKSHLEFRRGIVLAQAGRLSAAERVLRSSLSGNLSANEEQSALETLVRVLSERYRSSKRQSDLEMWTVEVDALFSRYPGTRSLAFLLAVGNEWLRSVPERALVLLRRSLASLSVVVRPQELLTIGFAQLAVRAAKTVDELSYFEDLFRKHSSTSGLTILEQAHHALAVQHYRELLGSGLEREAVDWLGNWVESNPQNAFRFMAHEELMSRNFRLGRFEEVYRSARAILAVSDGKTGLGPVKLLLAAAAERVRSREEAAQAYVDAFQQSEAQEPARTEAALALTDRFTVWMENALDRAQRVRVYDVAVSSGLASFNTVLRAWLADLGASVKTGRARPGRSDWGDQMRKAAAMDSSAPQSDPRGKLALWLAELSANGFARVNPLVISDEDAVALGEECLQIVGQIVDVLVREQDSEKNGLPGAVWVQKALSATPVVLFSLTSLKRLANTYENLVAQKGNQQDNSGGLAEGSLRDFLGPFLLRSIAAQRRLRMLSQSESLETLRLVHQVVVRAGYPLSSEEAIAVFGRGSEPPLAQIPQLLLHAMEGGLRHELR